MSKSSEAATAGILGGVTAGTTQARTDAKLASRKPSTMPLGKIQPRGEDTRKANAEHVAQLAASIEAIGLVEPLAVDTEGRLLAGLHRLEALKLLAEQGKSAELLKAVPVHRLDLDAEQDPDRALAIEVAENEHRRDYTAGEVRDLAERLKRAGFRDKAGRTRKGEKALRPALSAIVGKSGRQIRRILNPDTKTRTDVLVSAAEHRARALKAVAKIQQATADLNEAMEGLKELKGFKAGPCRLTRDLHEVVNADRLQAAIKHAHAELAVAANHPEPLLSRPFKFEEGPPAMKLDLGTGRMGKDKKGPVIIRSKCAITGQAVTLRNIRYGSRQKTIALDLMEVEEEWGFPGLAQMIAEEGIAAGKWKPGVLELLLES